MVQSTDIIARADQWYNRHEYKKAAITYDSAFANGVNYANDYFYAACYWSMANRKDSSFNRLNTSISYGFHDSVAIVTEKDLNNLKQDKRWMPIVKKVFNNKLGYDSTIKPYRRLLQDIYNKDQQIRILLMDTIITKYGEHSKEADSVARVMNNIDSVNLISIKAVLDKFGWRGPEDYGDIGATCIFLVIQHSNLATQEKYIPLLTKAVKENKAMPQYLATMHDRMLILKEKPQIYGTQLRQENGQIDFYPIYDPKNVNIRRKQAGLKTIEEYAAEAGIKYKE